MSQTIGLDQPRTPTSRGRWGSGVLFVSVGSYEGKLEIGTAQRYGTQALTATGPARLFRTLAENVLAAEHARVSRPLRDWAVAGCTGCTFRRLPASRLLLCRLTLLRNLT